MKNIKNIIFDFDGIIYPSQHYHINKLNEVFNLNITEEEYSMTGTGNANILMRKQEKFNKVNWDEYHVEIEKDFPLLKIEKDVKNVLENFEKDYNLFIISSGHNQHIIDFLKNNLVWNLFKKGLFLEDHMLKTDKFKILEKDFNITPEDSVFITDTIGDIKEGREVFYKSIGITTGIHDREILESENPLIVLDNFLELENYIKNN